MSSGTSASIRWFRALVTTYAPAAAKACSIGPATSASSALKTMGPGRGGAHSRTGRAAIRSGSAACSRQRTTSP